MAVELVDVAGSLEDPAPVSARVRFAAVVGKAVVGKLVVGKLIDGIVYDLLLSILFFQFEQPQCSN